MCAYAKTITRECVHVNIQINVYIYIYLGIHVIKKYKNNIKKHMIQGNPCVSTYNIYIYVFIICE